MEEANSFVVWVTVRVKPGMGEAFLEAARKNREQTRQEPDNFRFDVLRAANPTAPGEPELFYLLECYRDEAGFAAHQKTPHYLVFRDTVAEMMAEPRVGARAMTVFSDVFSDLKK